MNYNKFASEWEGDSASFLEIMNKMIGRFNNDLTDLNEANENSDAERVKFLAHKFKFVSKFLHADDLLAQIHQIEQSYSANQPEAVITYGKEMQGQINQLITLLKSKIET